MYVVTRKTLAQFTIITGENTQEKPRELLAHARVIPINTGDLLTNYKDMHTFHFAIQLMCILGEEMRERFIIPW